MPTLIKAAKEHVMSGTISGIEIKASKLGDNAGITGAAVLARRGTARDGVNAESLSAHHTSTGPFGTGMFSRRAEAGTSVCMKDATMGASWKRGCSSPCSSRNCSRQRV